MDSIDMFRQVMVRTSLGRTQQIGVDVWPAPRADISLADLYSAPILLARLEEALRLLGASATAECVRYPSKLAVVMNLFMQRPRDAVEAGRRRALASSLIEVLSLLRSGDPFVLSGRNQLPSYTRLALEKVSLDSTYSIHGLIARLNFYCEFAYFAFLPFGRENHGPYAEDDEQVFVREYFDLHPAFWDFPQSLPFGQVRIRAAYEHADLQCDFIGRSFSASSLPDKMSRASVEVDGSQIEHSSKALQAIIAALDKTLHRAAGESSLMSESELLQQWVRCEFWAFRSLFSQAGLAEEPPPELMLQLAGAAGGSWLSQAWRDIAVCEDEAEKRAMLLSLFDPGDQTKFDG